MNKRRKKVYDITFCAVFVAIISVLAQISIPTPFGVPITLQVFAVALTGYFLGLKKGLLCVFVYILSGMVGIPVFASFKGGFSTLLEATGGFIFGFVFLAFFCGICTDNKKGILFGYIGLLICYIIGTSFFAFITKAGFFKSLIMVALPFLPKDIILLPLAYFLSYKIKNQIKKGVD